MSQGISLTTMRVSTNTFFVLRAFTKSGNCFMKIHSLTKNFSNLMKKVNFKKVLMALVAVFALMVFGVEKAEAQAINEFSTGLYDPAPGTFFGSDEAKDVLVNTIASLKNSIANLPQGSPGVTAVRKTVYYYNGIYLGLLDGKSVSTCIGTGLYELNDCNGYGTLSRLELKNLRDGAIDLLQ